MDTTLLDSHVLGQTGSGDLPDFHDLFEYTIKARADQTFIEQAGLKRSFRDFDHTSSHMHDKGTLGYDFDICAVVPRQLDVALIEMWYSLVRFRRTFIVIDPTWPTELVLELFRSIRPSRLLIDPTMRDKLFAQSHELQNVVSQATEQPLVGSWVSLRLQTLPPGKLAQYGSLVLVTTSGSTGKPKVVVHSQRVFQHQLLVAMKLWSGGASQSASVGLVTSPAFVISWMPLLYAAVAGCRLVLAPLDRATEDRVIGFIEGAGVSKLKTTPSHVRQLIPHLRAHRVSISDLTHLCLSGEAVDRKLIDELRSILPGLIIDCVYGMSECPSSLCHRPTDQCSHERLLLGQPTPGVRTTQVTETTNDMGGFELGVSGPNIFLGHMIDSTLCLRKCAEADSSVFPTGDIVRDSEHGMEFVCRKDRIVKIRGYRIDLQHVEDTCARCPGMKEVAAIVYNGDLAVAYESEDVYQLEVRALRSFLDQAPVPRYLYPTLIRRFSRIPRLPSGKLDYSAILSEFSISNDVEDVRGVCPVSGDQIAEVIRRIWSECTGVDTVEITSEDSFSSLGGNSLSFLNMLLRVEGVFAVSLESSDLSESTPLCELVTLIRAREAEVTHDSAQHAIKFDQARDLHTLTEVAKKQACQISVDDEWIRFPLNQTQRARLKQSADLGADMSTTFVILQFAEGLDPYALKNALESIVNRHEAFRHVISNDRSGRVFPGKAALPLLQLDLATDVNISNVTRILSRLPFDLRQWPVFRTLVVRGKEFDYLVLQVSHCLIDLHGVNILQQELIETYVACCEGRRVLLPPIRVRPEDFARELSNLSVPDAIKPRLVQHLGEYENAVAEARAVVKSSGLSLVRLEKALSCRLPHGFSPHLILAAYAASLAGQFNLDRVPLRVGTGGRHYAGFGRNYRRLVYQCNNHFLLTAVNLSTRPIENIACQIENDIQFMKSTNYCHEVHAEALGCSGMHHIFGAGPLGDITSAESAEHGIRGVPRPLWGVRSLYRTPKINDPRIAMFSYEYENTARVSLFSKGVTPAVFQGVCNKLDHHLGFWAVKEHPR